MLRLIAVPALLAGLLAAPAPAAEAPSARRLDPVVVAASGDNACEVKHQNWAGGNGTALGCGQKRVSDSILADASVQAYLALGDYQYECGRASDYAASYTPTFGRLNNSNQYPVVGNHEYLTGTDDHGDPCPSSNLTAETYFDTFANSHEATEGRYSFDLGAWHIVALNGNCAKNKGTVGGCLTGSPQTVWLRNDLAADDHACTLAMWHQPLYNAESAPKTAYKPWWDALLADGAEVVLNGHTHLYARFAEMNSSSQQTSNGIVQYISGAGGKQAIKVKAAAQPKPAASPQALGWLRLSLADGGWSSSFATTTGQSLDPYSGTCS